MDREVEAIKHNLYQMCWFMRGGITIEQVYMMDIADHSIIAKIIKSNMETTKESGLPFF
jgi:hypothetical protein